MGHAEEEYYDLVGETWEDVDFRDKMLFLLSEELCVGKAAKEKIPLSIGEKYW